MIQQLNVPLYARKLPGSAEPAWMRLLIVSLIAVAAFLVPQAGLARDVGAVRKSANSPKTSVRVQLPAVFEPNRGQAGPKAQWVATGGSLRALINTVGVVLSTADKSPALNLHFSGANAHASSAGLSRLPGRSNYYIGNRPESWLLNIPNFAEVRYQQIYPGVDVSYHFSADRLEYDLIASPGADASRIRLAFNLPIRLTKRGDLETSDGVAVQKAPVAYQIVAGAQRFVSARYVIDSNGQVGFALGDYDHSKPVTIDPIIFSYWNSGPSGYHPSIAVDSAGIVYVTGGSTAPLFGLAKVEVYKLNLSTATILYHTTLDGNADDTSESIAIDANGNAYVAGSTNSANFPTHNAFQATAGGAGDGFLTKLDSSGNVVYSTYLGGSASDTITGVAVDANLNAYVTGTTSSANFPATPPISSISGGSDAFVTKFSADGLSLAYSKVFGGSGADSGVKIAVDSSSAAYVIGSTTSTDYPTTPGVLQLASGNVFVSKLDPTGASFTYSTYFAGTRNSSAGAIALDSLGDAFLTGTTQSADFPQVAPIFTGVDCSVAPCVYVSELNPSGTALVYSSALRVAGGVAAVQSHAIVLDSSGNAYVTGEASPGFPVTSPQLASFLGGTGTSIWDGFISEVAAGGSSLVFSTYVGSDGPDVGYGIAVDPTGNIYAIGEIFGGTTMPIIPSTLSSGLGGYLVELSPSASYPAATLDTITPTTAAAGATSFSITATGVNFAPNATLQWNGSNLATTVASGTQLTAQVPAANIAQSQTAQITVANPAPGGGVSTPLPFSVTNPTPLASTLSPNNAAVGSAAFTLTVNGSSFISASTVDWNGSPRTTTFISSTQLQAAIPATDLQTNGSKSVTVVNPPPGGGTSNTLTFNVTGNPPSFGISASPTSATVRAGQSATISLSITPTGGFNSAVTFSCSGLPAMASCTFTPPSVTPNGSAVSTSLVITTTGSARLFNRWRPTGSPLPHSFIFAVLTLIGFGFVSGRVRRKLLFPYLGVWILFAAGCGGGGYSQSSATTPAGTSTVTVSAMSGSNVQTLPVTITVTP